MKSHFKNIITIINPAAGSDTPILSQLNKATVAHSITNEIFVTQSDKDTTKFARRALRKKPDAVIVHGGDGTVVDVANVLCQSQIPLIIIPGGTANIIAKELGIPQDSAEALKILGRKQKPVRVNIASIGKRNMLVRIEVGILANMVKEATSELKENFGIAVYSFTALKHAINAPTARYMLNIDGKIQKIEGVGMMIANFGNIGLSGISLQKKVNCSDDLLDVLVLQSSDIATLAAVGSSALMGTKKPLALKHWRGKKIRVSITPKQMIVSDDKMFTASRFTVALKAEYLTILT